MVLKDMEQGIIRDFYPDKGEIRTWYTNKEKYYSKDVPNTSNTQEDINPMEYRSQKTKVQINDRTHITNGYYLTEVGELMANYKGHPLCEFCGIPSHRSPSCKYRIRDVYNGITRDSHPARGTSISNGRMRLGYGTRGCGIFKGGIRH